MIRFRALLPEEVEVRPCEANNQSVKLLLYQDARCAMNILDATLGPMAWQREYYEAAGLLFCKIGIFDSASNSWLWKSDTGSKSNIEGEKGLASDAFKRAAVAWGIGRELYTAPRISITLTDKDLFNGKLCQSFHVGVMEVKDGVITKLTIMDKWNKTRFSYVIGKDSETTFDEGKDVQVDFQSSNAENLKDFYSSLEQSAEVDKNRLKAFYDFYTKPSKEDPTKCVADTIKHFVPQARWDKWINN